MSWQRPWQQYVELHCLEKTRLNFLFFYFNVIVSANVFSGPGPGAFNQAQQPPAGATPPPHQPAMGLAQAQANNSNNKTGAYSGASMSANDLPEEEEDEEEQQASAAPRIVQVEPGPSWFELESDSDVSFISVCSQKILSRIYCQRKTNLSLNTVYEKGTTVWRHGFDQQDE